MFDFKKLIEYIRASRDGVDDQTAVRAKELYEPWKAEEMIDGIAVAVAYNVGDRRTYTYPDGKLKLIKCRQAHTAEAHHKPDLIPALWEVINEEHTGTLKDPIPYDQNMVVYKDKYYTYDEVLYICTRDSGQPLYNTPANLINAGYFQIV